MEECCCEFCLENEDAASTEKTIRITRTGIYFTVYGRDVYAVKSEAGESARAFLARLATICAVVNATMSAVVGAVQEGDE